LNEEEASGGDRREKDKYQFVALSARSTLMTTRVDAGWESEELHMQVRPGEAESLQ